MVIKDKNSFKQLRRETRGQWQKCYGKASMSIYLFMVIKDCLHIEMAILEYVSMSSCSFSRNNNQEYITRIIDNINLDVLIVFTYSKATTGKKKHRNMHVRLGIVFDSMMFLDKVATYYTWSHPSFQVLCHFLFSFMSYTMHVFYVKFLLCTKQKQNSKKNFYKAGLI